jgi:hypothetical protein
VTNLQTFYNTIDQYLSSSLATTFLVKVYDLTDAEPRLPILEDNFGVTLGTGAQLPNEVAICLSFRGESGSGVNIARRRGRIFLGPVMASTLDTIGGNALVQATVVEDIRDAALALNDAGGASNFEWATFSPTTIGPPPWSSGLLIAGTHRVEAGFVDNAFDTIRSRGPQATDRDLWVRTP